MKVPAPLRIAAILPCLGLAWASALQAQGLQNAVVGQTKDTSGAVLPGVTVTVTNVGTGVERVTTTDPVGNYAVPSLVAGSYTVRAELSGFKTEVRTGVVVRTDAPSRVDFVLSVGQQTEVVEVTADAAAQILRTEDASLGVVLGEGQIDALPVKNRNFMALAQIVPGATESLVGNQNSLGRAQPLNLSVHGQRHFDNNIRIDGVSIIAGFVNASTFIPSLESLKEVSVQTGQYSAAYGMYSGAQVDMVVKSGQNEFHGNVFGNLRHDGLNAKGYFDQGDKPPFSHGQYGATLGGPIKKNRTFFFVGWEGNRLRREATGQASVATDRMRAGDFSELSTVIRDPYTRLPFPGNVIPSSRISPQAQRLLEYVPHANRPGLASNYFGTTRSDEDENQFFLRLDHQVSTSDSLFFRMAYRAADNHRIQLNPNFQSIGQPQNQNYVLGYTKTFSSRVVSEVKASYVRESSPNQTGREGTDIDPLRDFGISGLNFDEPLLRGIPSAGITGYVGTGETFANAKLLYRSPALQAHTMLNLARHSMRFGGEAFRRYQAFTTINSRNQGSFSFTGQLTGNAFADFILGLPVRTDRIPFLLSSELKQDHFHAYVQDDWRVTSDLTVNLGVRYEYASGYRDILGHTTNFDFDTLTFFPEPGTDGALNDASHDLAPRLGIAYRWGQDTVIRGGYGHYITQPTMANPSLINRNPPRSREDTFNTNLTSPDLTLANGFLEGRLAGATSTPTLTTIPRDYGPGRAQVWSASVQRRLPGEWVGELGYVGSKTTGLDSSFTRNTPPPGPGAIQARRPNPAYGDVRVFATEAEASYNGVNVRLQNADWHGLNVLSSYTFAKCIDTKSSPATSTVGGEDQEPQDQLDRFDGQRGRCAIDFTHQFKFNAVYSIPLGKDFTGLAGALFKGWQVSASVNLHTGPPFTVIMGGNPANTSRGTIRPNLIGDPNLPADQRAPEQWFDTAAFAAPPPFTYGDAGRNIVIGPGTTLVDLGLRKRVRIRGDHALEVRIDAYNALNSPQFGLPGRVFGTPQFGRITSVGSPREIQLGLRYAF
ncbi:MAG TPA: TonB-dependent receptor [Vicinamibacteria bacterium]|nr:TonB-dependent receptor [Vicinamibacteria bacterium]